MFVKGAQTALFQLSVLQTAVFCRLAILSHVFTSVSAMRDRMFVLNPYGDLPLVDDQKI